MWRYEWALLLFVRIRVSYQYLLPHHTYQSSLVLDIVFFSCTPSTCIARLGPCMEMSKKHPWRSAFTYDKKWRMACGGTRISRNGRHLRHYFSLQKRSLFLQHVQHYFVCPTNHTIIVVQMTSAHKQNHLPLHKNEVMYIHFSSATHIHIRTFIRRIHMHTLFAHLNTLIDP